MSTRYLVLGGLFERLVTLLAIHLALGGARWPLAGLASWSLCHISVLVYLGVRERAWRTPKPPRTFNELAAESEAAAQGLDASALAALRAKVDRTREALDGALRSSGLDDEGQRLSTAVGWWVNRALSCGGSPEELGRFVTALGRGMQPVCEDCAAADDDGEGRA